MGRKGAREGGIQRGGERGEERREGSVSTPAGYHLWSHHPPRGRLRPGKGEGLGPHGARNGSQAFSPFRKSLPAEAGWQIQGNLLCALGRSSRQMQ